MNRKLSIRSRTGFNSLMINLTTNWHFMRWLRLAIALFLGWQLIQRPDIFTAFVAAFFLFQALTNTGCCGAGGCALPDRGNTTADSNSEDFKNVARK